MPTPSRSWSGEAAVMVALCLACAGLAAACAVPPRGLARASGRRTPALAAAVVALGVAGGWAADRPRLLVLGLVGTAVAAVGHRMWRQRRADRAAAGERAHVVAACEGMQAELAAGQSPGAALASAAGSWPLLAPVDRTAAAGGDVAAALRSAAVRPGAGDLRLLAAAWEVAHRTGHGLADAVGRVAAELRATERTRRIVTGELAAARATARLVAALPLVALAMGSGAGTDPWSFLLGHPLGIACLVAGLACGLAGLAWIEAIARDVDRTR
ncbi:hypothetical protein KUV85_12385 [Nocardioides panacisoli]|uniref:type II secretion system F family protein n=1 Tax=Nocardioides panacisoli TaxID=627624 RepID=UPI001C6365C3|nr:hypothetical protein [Nocardioides panacisoli]QYJ03130.1 hypothetical protein KUV85_12385 [Nocardioides panacisoli]